MRTMPRVPARAFDVGLAVVAVAMFEVVIWAKADAIGTPIAGPTWLVALLPLLMAVPLAWRHDRPLLVWCLIMSGLVIQALGTGDSPEGLELILPVGVGCYSVAAYGERRHAVIGLVIAVAGYTVYAVENHDIRTGKASELWAGSFFGVALLASWLFGIFVRDRRERAALLARADVLEREAKETVQSERARLARELHDIVSHNLSVVVLQAAGARALGTSDPSTLEKIERSGRESLVEMRRLLGVLRQEDDDASLGPQPGIADIEALAVRVRLAGLPVTVTVEGDGTDVPSAVDLSAYRIVQEALTNALRHAGAARASVTVRCNRDAVTIEVVDDGAGTAAASTGGHGLLGMRERVALFGGEFHAGPDPGVGYRVSARLPRDGGPA